jgi:hypothetical protein
MWNQEVAGFNKIKECNYTLLDQKNTVAFFINIK